MPLLTKKRYFMVLLLPKHNLGEPRKAIIITAALFINGLNYSNVIRVFSSLINTYVQNSANLFLYRCSPLFSKNGFRSIL